MTAVRGTLADHACATRAAGAQRYMKSQMPYRGVTMTDLRRLLRPLLAAPEHRLPTRAEWTGAALDLWDDAAYREERYAATELLRHRLYRDWQDPDLLPLLHRLITTGAWWDHVDEVATHHVGPLLLAYRAELTPTLRDWAVADDLWLRRTAIICQLGHKEATDLDLLTTAIDANLDTTAGGGTTPFGRDFFIRKAIGWALRQHARTDPAWVRAFVAEREGMLAGLSRREALKHLTPPPDPPRGM